MSLYEKAYEAYKAAEHDDDDSISIDLLLARDALGDLLNQLNTNDLAMVVNIAQNHVGENAHLMEPGEVTELRGAIERLEGVYK